MQLRFDIVAKTEYTNIFLRFLRIAQKSYHGYFFFPVAGQCIAGLSFDDTGTTHIGKFVINHSYMRPGIINVVVSVVAATIIGSFMIA